MKTLISILFLALGPVALADGVLTSCDWEAGHPSDPDKVGPGKGSGEVDTDKAIAACRAAVEAHPEVARFHYQLGRALVYAADRAGESDEVGMPHLQKAADMRHTQAMFVLGLMHFRHEQPCAAEPWTRAAAEAGLKSARISYSNHFLSGVWDSCPDLAGRGDMEGWLGAAREQVSGWYENMLLDVLERDLAAHFSDEGRP